VVVVMFASLVQQHARGKDASNEAQCQSRIKLGSN